MPHDTWIFLMTANILQGFSEGWSHYKNDIQPPPFKPGYVAGKEVRGKEESIHWLLGNSSPHNCIISFGYYTRLLVNDKDDFGHYTSLNAHDKDDFFLITALSGEVTTIYNSFSTNSFSTKNQKFYSIICFLLCEPNFKNIWIQLCYTNENMPTCFVKYSQMNSPLWESFLWQTKIQK